MFVSSGAKILSFVTYISSLPLQDCVMIFSLLAVSRLTLHLGVI